MRTIRFRGKDFKTGEWHYGFYTQGAIVDPHSGAEKVRHIIDSDMLYDIDPETLGQFTGLQDNSGNDIYEGDILQSIPKDEYIARIKQDDDAYRRLLEGRGVPFLAEELSIEEYTDLYIKWNFQEKAVVEYIDFGFNLMEITDNKLRRNFTPNLPEYWHIIGNIYD